MKLTKMQRENRTMQPWRLQREVWIISFLANYNVCVSTDISVKTLNFQCLIHYRHLQYLINGSICSSSLSFSLLCCLNLRDFPIFLHMREITMVLPCPLFLSLTLQLWSRPGFASHLPPLGPPFPLSFQVQNVLFIPVNIMAQLWSSLGQPFCWTAESFVTCR